MQDEKVISRIFDHIQVPPTYLTYPSPQLVPTPHAPTHSKPDPPHTPTIHHPTLISHQKLIYFTLYCFFNSRRQPLNGYYLGTLLFLIRFTFW